MAYRCLDCSYTTDSQIVGGRCPACGSYKMKSSRANGADDAEDKQRKPYKLVLLALLWLYLIFEIARKLLAE